MRSRLISMLTVIGAVTVLVLASNTVAIAATGKGFILGKTNAAKTTTTLKRTTAGSALSLRTKSSANAPLTVNGTGVVTNFNADKLDGLDANAFGSASALATTTSDLAATRNDLNATKAMTPIANGFINSNGTASGTNTTGVSNVFWNNSLSRYEVTLTVVDYYYLNYQTTITPTCEGTTASIGSYEGRLVVKFTDVDGNYKQCNFTFATTRLQ